MTNESQIKVAVVEDDRVIRESLAILITGASGFACTCISDSAEEAMREIPKHNPDVVLMDINLPGKSGVECVAALKERCPNTQFIMLTMFEDDQSVFDSLAAGASGYLLKRTPHVEILEAVTDVARGGSPMSSGIARKVVRSFQNRASSTGKSQTEERLNVSPREEEILRLLAKGYRYKEIADELGIGLETVRTHLRRVYEKLHVSSRTEAVVKFLGHDVN